MLFAIESKTTEDKQIKRHLHCPLQAECFKLRMSTCEGRDIIPSFNHSFSHCKEGCNFSSDLMGGRERESQEISQFVKAALTEMALILLG